MWIAPESPKPTVFLDDKGNLCHNQPSGQQKYQNDIPDSDEKRIENIASEPNHENAVMAKNDDGDDDEIPRFKSKATQARKRTIVISDDDEGADKGIRGSLRFNAD